jgi:hypothetical protein
VSSTAVTSGVVDAILTGNPRVGIPALIGYAGYEIGGAETIRTACSTATYGPQ